MATPVKTIPRPEYNGDPEALLDAVELGDLETVIVLIDTGIDIEYSGRTLREGDCSPFYTMGGGRGMTAMCWVASPDGACYDFAIRSAIMQELIRGGGDANKADVLGWAPLHHAAYGGDEEMVKFLVGAGADINIVMNCQGYRGGYTPLHSAMSMGHIEVAGDLVRLGADATAKDDEGKTMFEVACTEQERTW
jgi:hypothetical protein